MTWIVGAAPPIGYAVGISDVRVTFRDKSERDCLQKIYSVSDFIAAGFAGSVQIGFAMIEALRFRLRDLPQGSAWVPADVAGDLSPIAKELFEHFDAGEQQLRSDMMILGAHPSEDVGIPGYARTSIHILRSPGFMPEQKVGEVVSIGTGSVVPIYRQVLADIASDPVTLMQGEVMGAGMGFFPLAHTIQRMVEKHPTPGIGPHAHICMVRRGMVAIHANNQDRYPQSGDKVEFKMPQVATTWDEFQRITSAHGMSADGAAC